MTVLAVVVVAAVAAPAVPVTADDQRTASAISMGTDNAERRPRAGIGLWRYRLLHRAGQLRNPWRHSALIETVVEWIRSQAENR